MNEMSKGLTIRQHIVPIISAFVLGCLCVIFVMNTFFESRSNTISTIVRDLNKLVHMLETIDNSCGIIDFDHQKNSINFLNVISFVGSEVGSMNLRYPDKWEGPYLNDNPTIQHKEYQVVSTRYGYFITPGDGVVLPNGKVVGTDIKIDKDADIAAMMHQKDVLLFDNQSLAAPLYLPSHVVLMDDEEDY